MGKYLDKIRGREPAEDVPSTERRQAAPLPALRPGDLVTWQRGGSNQEGFVDTVHFGADGKQWVFVSWGNTWAAVNLKLVKVIR